MPNIASVLKGEIARVARKEVRAETETLKRASAQYRSTIAALKRRIEALEKQTKKASKGNGRRQIEELPKPEATGLRYSAKRLAAHRAKLGISAKDYGALIGVSGLTIYKWEGGTVRPRPGQLPAIAAVRGLGKREVAARLEELQS
jgi:DNA-binding transcriptional regulator YiaG